MATRQNYITARAGGPDGASVDTWETLAARASQLADANVTAHALIDANVGAGAGPAAINAWIASIGGVVSGDGVNYILPANARVKLPAGVYASSDGDAAAADAAASVAFAPPEIGPADNTATVLVVAGGVLLVGAIMLAAVADKRARKYSRPHRAALGGYKRRRRQTRRRR